VVSFLVAEPLNRFEQSWNEVYLESEQRWIRESLVDKSKCSNCPDEMAKDVDCAWQRIDAPSMYDACSTKDPMVYVMATGDPLGRIDDVSKRYCAVWSKAVRHMQSSG
jgi:hypothetical protein